VEAGTATGVAGALAVPVLPVPDWVPVLVPGAPVEPLLVPMVVAPVLDEDPVPVSPVVVPVLPVPVLSVPPELPGAGVPAPGPVVPVGPLAEGASELTLGPGVVPAGDAVAGGVGREVLGTVAAGFTGGAGSTAAGSASTGATAGAAGLGDAPG
jgi:hypothetical protein